MGHCGASRPTCIRARGVGLAPRPSGREDDAPAAARAALDWIGRSPGPCLLVIDNATDPDEVAPWLPAAGPAAQIVVTTTSLAFETIVGRGRGVDVGAFTAEEAADFLRERTALDDPPGAHSLAVELGFLPLALAQAAYVIRSQRISYATGSGEHE